jgi:hypothetical protein
MKASTQGMSGIQILACETPTICRDNRVPKGAKVSNSRGDDIERITRQHGATVGTGILPWL